MNKYVVVWLDSSHAQIFHVHPEHFDESTIWMKTHEVTRKLAGAHGGATPVGQQEFFADVARSLGDAEEILVVGPLAAKLELVQYAHANDARLSARIVGLETVEHPSDASLAQFARRYFVPASQMR
jgi:stalled ribosome rescue protein Dom34